MNNGQAAQPRGEEGNLPKPGVCRSCVLKKKCLQHQ